jgi:hypothetical protein
MNHVTHRCTYELSAREKHRVDVAHFPHGDAKLRVLLCRGMERTSRRRSLREPYNCKLITEYLLQRVQDCQCWMEHRSP